LIVGNDLIADVDTLVADVDRWSSNEFLNFILRFTAEGTTQRVVGSSHHNLQGSSLEIQALLGNRCRPTR
jgi:hypothetical protein